MSGKMCFCFVAVWLVLSGLTGCSDLGGGGTAGSQKEAKPSRDVDEQVDAAMKDFKNE